MAIVFHYSIILHKKTNISGQNTYLCLVFETGARGHDKSNFNPQMRSKISLCI